VESDGIFISFTTSSKQVFGERRYDLYSEYSFDVYGFKYDAHFLFIFKMFVKRKKDVSSQYLSNFHFS